MTLTFLTSSTAAILRHNSSSMIRRIEDENKASEWAEKFHTKECHFFCPKGNVQSEKTPPDYDDSLQCSCGELWKFHNREELENNISASPKKWDKSVHIRKHPGSNAYGEIEFKGDPDSTRKSAKYIRISDDDDIDEVLRFMLEYWGLGEPQLPTLCISVIGGAKNFNLLGHKRDVFQQGLIKASLTTGAWIITSGLNLGITRVVGDAVASGKTFHHDKKRVFRQIPCIGISPWGYVLNKEILVHPRNGFSSTKYTVTDKIGSGEPVSLNSNHTHYIFVDDGIRRKYGGTDAATVKSKIEKKIALAAISGTGERGLEVPVILIIVEGGQDVFIDCKNSIQQKVPVIICDKTGRAANVLALAAKEANKMKGSYESVERLLHHGLEEVLRSDSGPPKKEEEKTKMKKNIIENIQEIIKDLSLVTVFDTEVEEDFDSVILGALTKRRDEGMRSKLLELALTWKRIDMAEKVFKTGTSITPDVLNNCMRKALEDDKVEFVRLLLHHGVVMKELLTITELHNLYKKFRHSEYFELAVSNYGDERHEELYLPNIGSILRKMLGRFTNVEYNKDMINQRTNDAPNEKFENPFRELFLWAVLNFRHEMALFLWENVPHPIYMALIACKIYSSIIEVLPAYDTGSIKRYTLCKNEFEDLAMGILEECDNVDEQSACDLVERYYPDLGGSTSLDLGAAAGCQKFVSSVVCQNSLDARWNKGVDASLWRVVVCICLPIFIPFNLVIKYGTNISSNDSQKTEFCIKCETILSMTMTKIITFYDSPKTKFCIHVMGYLFFQLFYCYFLLFDMKENQVTPIEIVVFIYIGALLIDEIREVIASRKETLYDKLKDWWNFTSWNKLDILIIVTLLVAAFCRIGLIYDNRTAYVVSRSFYVVAAVFLFTRVLRLYSAHHALGPKLAMVTKMVSELIIFLLLLAVPLFAYGVTTQSLLYPGRPFNQSVLLDIVYLPYFSMFNNMGLNEANAVKDSCNKTLGLGWQGDVYCPQYHAMAVLDYAVYLMIEKVLLLTLLIAIFTNIFEEVQANSIQIWKYKIHALVIEHEKKTICPIPLSIIENIITIGMVMSRVICHRRVDCRKNSRHSLYLPERLKELEQFENKMRLVFIRESERRRDLKFESQLNAAKEKVADIVKTMEDCQRAFTDIYFLHQSPKDHSHDASDEHAHHHHHHHHPPPVGRHESQLSDLSSGTVENNYYEETEPQAKSHGKMKELYEKDKTQGIEDVSYHTQYQRYENRLQELEKRMEALKERGVSDFHKNTSSISLIHPPPGFFVQSSLTPTVQGDNYENMSSQSKQLISSMEARLQHIELLTKNSLKSIEFILHQLFENSSSMPTSDEPQPQFY